jgi:hypothetical protein
MYVCTDAWVDGWMDGWMDSQSNQNKSGEAAALVKSSHHTIISSAERKSPLLLI